MRPGQAAALVSLVLMGAIFGFFYAYVCTVMWGLDAAAPQVAIEAMQEINAAVRNPVFFPAFFLTPLALALTGFLAQGGRAYFFAAAVLYTVGAFAVTAAVNVPMNEALGALSIPDSEAEARAIWDAYSPRWQLYNLIRTVVSGICLVLVGLGLMRLGEAHSPTREQ